MEYKCPFIDLDTARFRLRCGTAALNALYVSVAEDDPFLADAIYGVYDYLRIVSDEISNGIDDCFEFWKKEREIKHE